MSEPTFSTRFGLAVQEDILRQAAADQQLRQARSLIRRQGRSRWLVAAAGRLAGTFRRRDFRRLYRGPAQAEAAAPCRTWSQPTNLMKD